MPRQRSGFRIFCAATCGATLVLSPSVAQHIPSLQEQRQQTEEMNYENQRAMELQQLEEQVKAENICKRMDIKNLVMSRFNREPVFTKDHGKVVRLIKPETEDAMIESNLLTCRAVFVFEDGSKKITGFNMPYIFIVH